jgi:2'-5' RNA ligase
MKPSIVIIAHLTGIVADRIHELQQRFDPRMAGELPPHVTLIGSSGLGPIAVRTSPDVLRDALAPVASRTSPMSLVFDPPKRFMQSDVVVLPLDPHGPLRALHDGMVEELRAAKIVAEPARFTFTPHCTLSLYRELPPPALRDVLAVRLADPVEIRSIAAYRARNPMRSEELFALDLSGETETAGS